MKKKNSRQKGFVDVLALLGVVIILLVIPVSVNLLGERQELRKFAYPEVSPSPESQCICLNGAPCPDNLYSHCPSNISPPPSTVCQEGATEPNDSGGINFCQNGGWHSCPQGTSYENGECKSSSSPQPCSEGQTEINEQGGINFCQEGRWFSCPTGQVYKDGYCQSSESPSPIPEKGCPEGKAEFNDKGGVNFCQNGKWFSCPSGQIYKDGACKRSDGFTGCPSKSEKCKGNVGDRCWGDEAKTHIMQCMPDGKWEPELWDDKTKQSKLNNPCIPGETGIDADKCHYTCKAGANNQGKFEKDNSSCPQYTTCYPGEKRKDPRGCTVVCKGGFSQEYEDNNCVCGDGTILNENPLLQEICVNNTRQKKVCQEGSVVVEDDEGNYLSFLKSCPNKNCYKGDCVDEGLSCQSNSVIDGNENVVKDCGVNGCTDGHCNEIFLGYCNGETRVFENGCTYKCKENNYKIYWEKVDPNCFENGQEEFSCQDNDVYKFRYKSDNNYSKAQIDTSTYIKTCESGCSLGECSYPENTLCAPGTRQYDGQGRLLECVTAGPSVCPSQRGNWQCPGGDCDKCGCSGFWASDCDSFCSSHPNDVTCPWKPVDFGIKLELPPDISNLQRQTLYNTLLELQAKSSLTKFWGTGLMNRIKITSRYIYRGNKEFDDNMGGYFSNDGSISMPMRFLDNPFVLTHEIAHSLQNCGKECDDLVGEWKSKTGWTVPDPNGTGIINQLPTDTFRGYSSKIPTEDMADGAAYYYTYPCYAKMVSSRRYEEAKELFFTNKTTGEVFEFLPPSGCSGSSSSNPTTQVAKIKELINKSVLAAEENSLDLSVFEKIIPGKTTEEEALNLLGTPTKDYKSNEKDVFWYQAADKNNFHTIIFKNGVVYFITVHLGQKWAENISSYGKADKETFNYYSSETKTYIYGSKGLALTADLNGIILVKQKFLPRTVQEFLLEWGKEFPSENPYQDVMPEKPTYNPQPVSQQIKLPFFQEVLLNLINLLKKIFLRGQKTTY